ncbi:hypothetical protein ILYODFUR_037538 [Ilyodon furcidens]|uniref:Uncharacterized protein n=1 Tax=Ilyodon furcidens TaxID=33524 RepID=A0ABV0T3F9_9TELE
MAHPMRKLHQCVKAGNAPFPLARFRRCGFTPLGFALLGMLHRQWVSVSTDPLAAGVMAAEAPPLAISVVQCAAIAVNQTRCFMVVCFVCFWGNVCASEQLIFCVISWFRILLITTYK